MLTFYIIAFSKIDQLIGDSTNYQYSFNRTLFHQFQDSLGNLSKIEVQYSIFSPTENIDFIFNNYSNYNYYNNCKDIIEQKIRGRKRNYFRRKKYSWQ